MPIFGLLMLAFSQEQPAIKEPSVAFLDGRSVVKVGFQQPRPMASLTGALQLSIGGQRVGIARVEPAGEPDGRTLPRTEGRIVLAGTFQSKLGGKDWDPDGEVTQMTEDAPGVFSLVVKLPGGRYEYKVTRNGGWGENWGVGFAPGGGNLAIEVPKKGGLVRLVVDFNAKTIRNSLADPGIVSPPTEVPTRPTTQGPKRYNAFVLKLGQPISLADLKKPIRLAVTGEPLARTVFAREVLSDPELRYEGNDLGARWSRAGTTFKVWSPVATKARLLLYPSANGGTPKEQPMHPAGRGIWTAWVPGDLHGRFYQFQFTSYGELRTAPDIYAFSGSPDARRSMVVDLSRSRPAGWPSKLGKAYPNQTDAILYEMSVRDFTSQATSGMDPKVRGKYAGLVQAGTTLLDTKWPTGLDYLKQLGVTHVHLLPVQNFLTSSPTEYTWGYATHSFNVPEETYSVTPRDPVGVLREFKQMVSGLHRAGIGVVMDVVYNHTWPPSGADSPFWQTVPYYYFRTNDRGDVLNESGVGNALHDERPMVRKFVRDSLLYWLDEYQVDGFRFDLLGMHDPASVRDWAKALRAKRPDIILYGEPWTGGGPTRFGKGAQRGSTVAVFNDDFRNVFRGDLDEPRPGFGMGGVTDMGTLENMLTGASRFADSPTETINYVSAHDNMTLRDRIQLSLGESHPELQESAVRFMTASVLLAPGIPFLEGGVELGRTKAGNPNSYNAGDLVNGYAWERLRTYRPTANYVRGMIQLRKSQPLLRIGSAAELKKRQVVLRGLPEQMFGYRLTGSGGEQLVVLLNGSVRPQTVRLPTGAWQLLANGSAVNPAGLGRQEKSLRLEPLSVAVLRRG